MEWSKIIDELDPILYHHKSIPLQRLCTESHKFIIGIETNFHQWDYKIADTVSRMDTGSKIFNKWDYNAVYNVVSAFIDILVDNPSFLMDLLKAENEETSEMDNEQREDREDSKIQMN